MRGSMSENQYIETVGSAPVDAEATPSALPYLGVGALIMLIGFFATLYQDRGGSSKALGSARWGGKRERNNAKKEAIRQIKSNRKDEIALWINAPESIDGKKIKGDSKSVWLPYAANGTSVIGGSGTGKSYTVIIPTLRSALAQGIPIALLDTDYPGLTKAIAPLAESIGYKVDVFAPGFEESGICNVLDFIADARDSSGASQLSKTFIKNFQMGGKGSDPFWQMSGELVTEATLLLAKALPDKDLLTAFTILKDEDMIDRIRNVGKIDPWLDLSFGQLLSTAKSEKTVDSIRGTAALLFGALMRPDIMPSIIGESTIPTKLEGKRIVIFGVKQDIRMAVSPLIAAVIHALVTKNMIPGRKEPLFLSLDEMPSMYFPEISEWLSEKRKYGLCTQIGYQSLGQLIKTYGKDLATVIFTNTATKILFNPQHIDSAETFSRTLGDKEIRYTTKGSSKGQGYSRTRNEHRVKKRLWTPDEFLSMGKGSCVVLNPAYSSNRRFFVPMKFDPVEIVDKELRVQEASENAWEGLRMRLVSRGVGNLRIHPRAIDKRKVDFQEALPLEKKDDTSSPNYGDLLA